MKGKVRPHRLYKKKSGKLYIKKGNKKVVIHTSPSLSLKKILAYVQKNIKSERTQPKKHVKAQQKSKPLAALPLSQATQVKQDFASSILNHQIPIQLKGIIGDIYILIEPRRKYLITIA